MPSLLENPSRGDLECFIALKWVATNGAGNGLRIPFPNEFRVGMACGTKPLSEADHEWLAQNPT